MKLKVILKNDFESWNCIEMWESFWDNPCFSNQDVLHEIEKRAECLKKTDIGVFGPVYIRFINMVESWNTQS